MTGEGRAMTSERLEAIRGHVEMAYQVWMDDETSAEMIRDYPDLPHDFTADGDALLAEVERLRAENDELRQIASCLPVMFRAFQERHSERSGGDGA